MATTIQDIIDELKWAQRKFPVWPDDPIHAATILAEEAGELQKAILQMTYEPQLISSAEVRKEAIQTAAMALRFLANFEGGMYRFEPARQHDDTKNLARLRGEES